MATVSTPVHAYMSQIMAGTVLAKSSDLTVAFSFVGFEAKFEVKGLQPNTSQISSGWEANVYLSTDNAGSYETVPSYSRVIARNPNVTDQVSVTVPGGTWLIRLTSSGSAATTWSFLIGTVDVLTAISNA